MVFGFFEVILHASSVINDLVLFSCGGPEINNWPRRLDITAVFRDGLRVTDTDTDTMEIVSMVLFGKINKTPVSLINNTGATAVGLSGMDDLLLTARPSPKVADLGFVGEVARVDSTAIRSLLETGQIPEVNSIAADETGQPYNIISTTIFTGWMPTILRAGRGMTRWEHSRPDTPPGKLELFSYENNSNARIVREALCELELPYILQNVGEGSHRMKLLLDTSGSKEVPYFIDHNTGFQSGDCTTILSYLFETYSTVI